MFVKSVVIDGINYVTLDWSGKSYYVVVFFIISRSIVMLPVKTLSSSSVFRSVSLITVMSFAVWLAILFFFYQYSVHYFHVFESSLLHRVILLWINHHFKCQICTCTCNYANVICIYEKKHELLYGLRVLQ